MILIYISNIQTIIFQFFGLDKRYLFLSLVCFNIKPAYLPVMIGQPTGAKACIRVGHKSFWCIFVVNYSSVGLWFYILFFQIHEIVIVIELEPIIERKRLYYSRIGEKSSLNVVTESHRLFEVPEPSQNTFTTN